MILHFVTSQGKFKESAYRSNKLNAYDINELIKLFLV